MERFSNKKNISWEDSEENTQKFLEKMNTFIGKKINPHRKYKSICSIRKENRWRTSLMERMNIDNSIIRYVNSTMICENTFTNALWKKYVNNFPTMQELVEEYEQCYFSFIVESCNNEEGTMMPTIRKNHNRVNDRYDGINYFW